MKRYLYVAMMILCCNATLAQVGINNINPQANLDIVASSAAAPANTDGILIPRIDTFPATNPTAAQHGMMVYLTTAVGLNVPGFYFWNNTTTQWESIGSGADQINQLNDGINDGNSIFLGNNSGTTDDGGNNNTALGNNAMALAVDATANSAFGYQSLGRVVDGIHNTGLGFFALANVTSDYNTAVGSRSMQALDTGEHNTAVGFDALSTIDSGSYNTAVGSQVLQDSRSANNTAVGYATLTNSTSGTANTAMGSLSADALTTGSLNVAMGYQSLSGLTDADNNVAIGYRAGRVSNGSENVFIGSDAGYTNATTNQNVLVGRSAGYLNRGSRNVYLGYGAGYNGDFSSNNVFIGFEAGRNETGSDRLYIENSNSSTPLIYGDFVNDLLRVNGQLQVNNPSGTGYSLPAADGALGQVLTTNGSGSVGFATITQNTLDQAYDQGGAGAGSIIIADSGAVTIAGRDGFAVTGIHGSGTALSITADLSTAFFNPATSITRSGFASGTTWSIGNMGQYSVAMGYSPTASGTASTGFGYLSQAIGDRSTAMGNGTIAPSFAETALGNFNSTYTPNDANAFDAGDRLFVIGNGTSAAVRSNALSVYKDGRVNINDAYNLPTTDGTLNQVLTTDGSGQVSWAAASANTASNGLTDVASDIQLGGNLTQNTTVQAGSFNLAVNLNSTGEFLINDAGTTHFEVDNTGEIYIGDDLYWRNGSTAGTNLGRLYGTTNGNLGLYSSGTLTTRFNAGGDSYFNGGQVGIGTNNPQVELDVRSTAGTTFIGSYTNESTNTDADGLAIRLDATNPNAAAQYIGFFRQSTTQSGSIVGTGAGTGVSYTTVSDKRLKTNFTKIENALSIIAKIKPLWYEYKSDLGKKELGVLAQDLQTVYPQAVHGSPQSDVNKAPMTVDYSRLTPLLAAGTQELAQKVAALEAENELLKAQLAKYESLEARILALEEANSLSSKKSTHLSVNKK